MATIRTLKLTLIALLCATSLYGQAAGDIPYQQADGTGKLKSHLMTGTGVLLKSGTSAQTLSTTGTGALVRESADVSGIPVLNGTGTNTTLEGDIILNGQLQAGGSFSIEDTLPWLNALGFTSAGYLYRNAANSGVVLSGSNSLAGFSGTIPANVVIGSGMTLNSGTLAASGNVVAAGNGIAVSTGSGTATVSLDLTSTNVVAVTSGTAPVDFANGVAATFTATGNTTVTLANVPTMAIASIAVTQTSGTTGYVLTFPAGTKQTYGGTNTYTMSGTNALSIIYLQKTGTNTVITGVAPAITP